MGKYPYFPKVKTEWSKQQTFDGITIKEVTTPSENPPANYMKIYFKADGKLYKLNSSGAETVSNSTVSAITQALLDAKANINNPSFTGVVTIPNIANLETAVTANTAKVGITSGQASAITANTAKVGITSGQASNITTNNDKVGITSGQTNAIIANTAKVGITSGQASAITANTAKVGITSGQANAITANTAKVSLDDNSVTLAKLAHGTAGTYLGFNDSTGVPEEKTVSAGGGMGVLSYDTTIGNHTYATTATSVDTGTTYTATYSNESGGFAGNIGSGSNGSQAYWQSYVKRGDLSPSAPVTITDVAFQARTYWSGNTFSYVRLVFKDASGNGVGSFQTGTVWKNSNWTSHSWSGQSAVGATEWGTEYWSQGSSVHIQAVTWGGTAVETRVPTLVNSANGAYWGTVSTVNPALVCDFGSPTRMSQIVIKPVSQDTETIYQLQFSLDASTWVTKRTINKSLLTDGAYNYVRFNPITARYFRLRGSSGASVVSAIEEIKSKNNISDDDYLDTHSHLAISTTDNTLALNGE